MSQRKITIARVYTLEGHDHLNQTLKILQHEKVAGVTVTRGIAGIGSTGELHTSSLLSLSLELPIIIEFHEEPEKVESIIAMLKAKLDLKHIVSWPATVHI
jgi:PII-like signaling protein